MVQEINDPLNIARSADTSELHDYFFIIEWRRLEQLVNRFKVWDDALAKYFSRWYVTAPPVIPSHSWILSSMNDKQIPGNPPLSSHGTLQPVQGGLSFDGYQTSLSGRLPNTACVIDPDSCVDGFAFSMKLRFYELSLTSNKPQYVLDSGASTNRKGVSVFLQLNSLYFKVATSNVMYQVRM